jgi:hypothetical protein
MIMLPKCVSSCADIGQALLVIVISDCLGQATIFSVLIVRWITRAGIESCVVYVRLLAADALEDHDFKTTGCGGKTNVPTQTNDLLEALLYGATSPKPPCHLHCC